MRENKKKAFWWLVFALLFFVLAGGSGFAVKIYRDYQNIPVNHWIGNKASNTKALKEKGLPFSFLVLGDPHCSERAKNLIELALKNGESSFLVILGDIVKSPDVWNYRLFLTEMTVDIHVPVPIFLATGNHDIDYLSSKIKRVDRRVTPEVFESLFGARNFDFVFNNCLFIICGVDLKTPTQYLDDLRKTLAEKGAGKKHIFVFVHFPPGKLAGYISGPLPMKDDFLSLLETYKVSASFFGDFHGYWRGQRKGVNLIVSGGGGRLKAPQTGWGRFHHILRVNVDHDIISEEMIILPEQLSLLDPLKGWLFRYYFPIMNHRKWVPYCLFFLFLSSGIYSAVLFVHFLKKKELDKPVV